MYRHPMQKKLNEKDEASTILPGFCYFHTIFTKKRFYLRNFHTLLGTLSVETGILSLVASATLPQRK